MPEQPSRSPKLPRAILNNIFAFPPNRDTLGGTAYLIVENEVNILLDCPAWDETNQDFLHSSGGVQWLFLTHRGGIGRVREIQQTFGCQVLIQEQEAYLLPGLTVTGFQQEFTLIPSLQAVWTPGHSPGSSCLYYGVIGRAEEAEGARVNVSLAPSRSNSISPSVFTPPIIKSAPSGGLLFTGRHLLPNQRGEPVPLKTAKTFHWPRQLKSVQSLLDRFTPTTLQYLCPGANTGFLQGKLVIEQAYQQLACLDLEALLQAKSPL